MANAWLRADGVRGMVSLECRAAGTAAAADAAALRELLQGLSGFPPARVYQHELVLKGPGQERQAVELRLTHHLGLPLAETDKKEWQRERLEGCALCSFCFAAAVTTTDTVSFVTQIGASLTSLASIPSGPSSLLHSQRGWDAASSVPSQR